ncbi:CRISPR-associated protein Csx20 [Spirochaeta dissipatitropha]
MNLLVLMNHKLTPNQVQQAKQEYDIQEIIYPTQDISQLWANIPAESASLSRQLQPVYTWIEKVTHPGDVILVQGDFGAVFGIVSRSLADNLIPIYATTKRIAIETESNGVIHKQSQFQHVLFRKYQDCLSCKSTTQ